MTSTDFLFALLLVLALLFDFLNGFHDCANIVATLISSRAMSPRSAMILAATAEFAGPFIFGVAVATTIGRDVVSHQVLNIQVVIGALSSACIWNLITWFFGLPSSSSHALLGGLVGATAVSPVGLAAIHAAGLIKAAIALFISPVLGLLVGALVIRFLILLTLGATPRVNLFFRLAQLPTALILALSHGANDAQKTMGIITLGLVILGYQTQFYVPFWVITISAAAMALGTALGGRRIMHTLGVKFYRIRPMHSFASQIASACVILGASLLGGPVSTTQVVSSSILGAGAGQRLSQVRWHTLGEILLAWLLTIPATAALAVLFYWLAVALL